MAGAPHAVVSAGTPALDGITAAVTNMDVWLRVNVNSKIERWLPQWATANRVTVANAAFAVVCIGAALYVDGASYWEAMALQSLVIAMILVYGVVDLLVRHRPPPPLGRGIAPLRIVFVRSYQCASGSPKPWSQRVSFLLRALCRMATWHAPATSARLMEARWTISWTASRLHLQPRHAALARRHQRGSPSPTQSWSPSFSAWRRR